MIDPSLALFAIEAGVKLGRKVYDVLVDATVEGPLLLPVGNLFGDIIDADAVDFFDRAENRSLTGPNGPYASLDRDGKILAYKTLRAIDARVATPTGAVEPATEIILRLHAFEQVKKGFGAKSPWQRILGTVVEIGIDYFAANPAALGKDSPARGVVESFLMGIADVDFAEGAPTEILGSVLSAALHTFGQNASLLTDDKRAQALLGGVAEAFVDNVNAATSQGDLLRRQGLAQRIGSSILRGAASAVAGDTDLFIPRNETARRLVHSGLTQLLEGVRGQEDLFTNESLEALYKSALGAVAENADLFSDQKILQQLIQRTLTALTDTQGRKLFAPETVPAVLQAALEVVRDNVETLVDPEDPQQQLLACAASAVARSLASALAGGGKVKDLLSKAQLVDLTKAVFQEVAKHPEQLLGKNVDDVKRTALAQIIGSVASGLGEDPLLLVNGAGFVQLVKSALPVAIRNADKLLNLESADPATNGLFKVIEQIQSGISGGGDKRKLVGVEVFLEIAQYVLPIASAHTDVFAAATRIRPIEATVAKALELANTTFANRINGANLPGLIGELLHSVLDDNLSLDETNAVETATLRILRNA